MGAFKRGVIISLGGSIEPIVSMINEYLEKDDVIVFLTSDTGKEDTSTKNWIDGVIPERYRKDKLGKVVFKDTNIVNICKDKIKSGMYKVISSDPDDLEEIFSVLKSMYEELKKSGVHKFIANFTGGTKMMSAAIVLFAVVYDDVELYFNRGARTNVIKEINSEIVQIKIESIMFDLLKEKVNSLFDKFQYDAAVVEIKSFQKKYGAMKNKDYIKVVNIAEAFSLWDKFDFEGAYERLFSVGIGYEDHLKVLDMLRNKSEIFYGYKAEELMENAMRRACNKEYDNATARLYRALEVLAQAILYKAYNVKTDKIENIVAILKKEQASEADIKYFGTKERGIGLMDAYRLLSILKITKDVVGPIFKENKNKMKALLNNRNYSILAHGFSPISEKEYTEFYSFCRKFFDLIYAKLPKNLMIKYQTVKLPQKLF